MAKKGKGKGWHRESRRHAEAAKKGSSNPATVTPKGYKPGQGATTRAPKGGVCTGHGRIKG